MCFACEKWQDVYGNIYAIGKTIEALRGIERWGTGDMVEQAFTGFVALPPRNLPMKSSAFLRSSMRIVRQYP